MRHLFAFAAASLLTSMLSPLAATAAQLQAGVARVEITDREAGPVHDPSFVKALVLRHGDTTAVFITVDAVAIGGIGRIGNDYLTKLRGKLRADLGIPRESVIVNASHCHSARLGNPDSIFRTH